MGIMARLIPGPVLSERAAIRTDSFIIAAVRAGSDPCDAVTITDISTHGFRITGASDLAVGSALRLELPSLASLAATVVRRDADGIGCRFDTPLSLIQVREITAGRGWNGIA